MNKKIIYILLIILGLLSAYMILGDLLKNEIRNGKDNPYAFDLRDFEHVDPELIMYEESKRIKLNNPKPNAIAYGRGRLALAFDNMLQLIDTAGIEHLRVVPGEPSTAIHLSEDDHIYLAFKTHLKVYDIQGNLLETWSEIDTNAYITSIVTKGENIFVANAGGPEVIRYDKSGNIEDRFDGKNKELGDQGFIVPSPYFDLAIDTDEELWVANTGIQSIQNYTSDGKLRGHWGTSGYKLTDFTGCCNPAHFTILSDGSFATSEKGLVRIKVHKPSGELESFIAAPEQFGKDTAPLDLTSDEHDNIYALDVSLNMIRKFERK